MVMNDADSRQNQFHNEHLAHHFALIYAPRRKRERYPENTVKVVESAAAAIERADPANNHFPAEVRGPFRSSEGSQLYYLVKWLDGE